MSRRGRPPIPIVLSRRQLHRLNAFTESGDARLAKRARVVLGAAEGWSNLELAYRVGLSETSVCLWRHRFADEGIEGLRDRRSKSRGRPGRAVSPLPVTAEQREVLLRWLRRRKSAAGLAVRSKIVLLAADGLGPSEIAAKVECSRATAHKWRKRFQAKGLRGLSDEYREGRPRTVSDERVEEVVTKTLEQLPADGSTHWSTRSMSRATGLSPTTIGRIWRAFGLKPHRYETFKISTDPNFVEKVHDVVGLYLNPPERAVVLCLDEKTGIQALDRTQPAFPILPGTPARATHDYIRNGTIDLFAALDAATGEVLCRADSQHRAVEFRKFLDLVDVEVPDDLQVHVILDNASTHKTPAIQRWLKRHPRFQFHFTPTSSSWLNLVERWFAELTNKKLRRSAHRNTRELTDDILSWKEHWNEDPRPFVWRKTADEILNNLRRYCQRTSAPGH